MRTIFASIALAISLIAAPAAAQSSARDFTLPEGQSEPAARPQGPVDDTGIIPVGPRVIRTEPEQPAAAPTTERQPAPVPAPEGAETATTQRTATPPPSAERQTNAAPVQSAPITAPAPADTATEPEPDGIDPQAETSPLPTSPVPLPELTQAEESSDTQWQLSTLPQWIWWLAGLLGLVVAALGLVAWLRRRAELRPPPEIEQPIIVEPTTAALAAREQPQFAIRFDVQGFTRSMMMVTVKFSLQISNRSDIAMRDVRIAADLVSARRQLPMEQQVATTVTELAHKAEIERIGPQQSRSITGTLQLPMAEVEPFFQGKTPLFVPLARLRVECERVEPQLQTYIVGMGSAMTVGKVQPIPLNTPPGSIQGIMARALNQA